MTRVELEQLLADIRTVRVAVIGDFCLDAYWFMDSSASEISVETGLATRPVKDQRYTLGGAGNVVSNLVAMGVGLVRAFGVIGHDPYGWEMIRLLQASGVDVAGILTQEVDWDTHVYTKPVEGDEEQNRIDFGNFNRLAPATAAALLERLDRAVGDVDVVIVNQQVVSGIHTESFRADLTRLIGRHPERVFVVDSRKYSDVYAGAYRKLNQHEAARLCGIERPADEPVLYSEATAAAEELYRRWQRPLFVTRGSRGCLVRDEAGLHVIPGIQILGRIDPVGAGDSMLAGIAAALAAGRDPVTAATLGNFVAGVTVQKLFQTGTASPQEILDIGADPDYVYRPELAEDPRQARFVEGTEIEIVSELPHGRRITRAIFDHDGTLSTLRQGWESIMEPMMIRAVLGDSFQEADELTYQKVVRRVREYIDKTTGVQTLVQMKGLVEIVREFGRVPASKVLDELGYKEIYDRALLAMVRGRMARLRAGELDVEDFTIKNAVKFLRALHAAGVKLYLASGTDEKDVVAEAEALGYAELFAGRIYGAVGDITKEAKRIVLDRIMRDVGKDAYQHLVTFGDGPVEIRETHKRGGYAVGVASDEVRRYELNSAKRARLIRAGADLIVPDYSQMNRLLRALGIG